MNSTEKKAGPGVRYSHGGQYVPTVDGIDQSPTSFDRDRALQIAQDVASGRSGERAEVVRLREVNAELLAALENLMGKKSCGHDFDCVCAGDMARAAIAKAKQCSQ